MKLSLVVKACVAAYLVVLISGCDKAAPTEAITGYVEANYIYLAAPESGWITEQAIELGSIIEKGQVVTQLDDDYQNLSLTQQQTITQQKQAQLADLTQGARTEELNVLRSQLHEANIQTELAKLQFTRAQQLHQDALISQAEFDSAKLTLASKNAKEVTIKQQIKVLELGARKEQVIAKQQEVKSSNFDIEKSLWQKNQRMIIAHQSGIVDEIYFRQGEFVNKGQPVLSLLLPRSKKVRFYLPQAKVVKLTLGKNISVVTQSSALAKATVSYIANSVEFTPPVLYDNTNRQALVFLVEATFNEPIALHPGQPVDIVIND